MGRTEFVVALGSQVSGSSSLFPSFSVLTLSGYLLQELYCFLPCLAFLDASLLVMIEEFAMIWPNLVENYVFVAVNLGVL
ncbi:hypothetical protein P8452_28747 [Trifolium repens]|nr:hypothetical protein P8452_28747 [Trifolium repens]